MLGLIPATWVYKPFVYNIMLDWSHRKHIGCLQKLSQVSIQRLETKSIGNFDQHGELSPQLVIGMWMPDIYNKSTSEKLWENGI